MTTGYKAVPRQISGNDIASVKTWAVQVAEAVNQHNQGKMNVTLDVTLTAGATTTTVTDSRISQSCGIHLSPKTANAAAVLASTYVSSQSNGSAVITHPNNANTDKNFRLVLIG